MTLPIAALSETERRRFHRLPLDHPVDLVDLDGGARFTGRARGSPAAACASPATRPCPRGCAWGSPSPRRSP